jgi:asparagine synthase (glutamine-hydrolysing)
LNGARVSRNLRDMAIDLLTGPSSFVGTTFDPPVVDKLLKVHLAGDRNEQARLWTLLSLEVWHREFSRHLH